jgi:lipopolysaccharide/colanic/teichoic acid biosynthesis glycosyltransferase
VYSIASKFAELMRLAPTALNYVLYPRFASLKRGQADAQLRSLFPRALLLTVLMTPFVAIIALFGPHLLYGEAFDGAVGPAEIITLGLSIEGAAAVASAYLLGTGRPGLNSLGMGVGAALTVGLDVLLIPRYGALGGAITSAVVYATTTITLSYIAHRIAAGEAGPDVRSGSPAQLQLDHGRDTPLRRMTDIAFALTSLLLTMPMFVLIALAVRLTTPGPILYRQVRVGRSGRLFTLFKFRSMVVNAEALGGYITTKNDNRVTRVGRLLRASKLDELPQLVNILRGEMTLVGPRPEVPYFVRWYSGNELRVLSVRPGLTGLGQLIYTGDHLNDGPSTRDVEAHYLLHQLHQKLLVDLSYLRERGFWADLVILTRTFGVIFQNSKKTLVPTSIPETSSSSLRP